MSTNKSLDIGVLLHLAFGEFKWQLHQHLHSKGFTDLGPLFGYVFRYLQSEPRSLAQVARLLRITPQGALKIIDDMEAKGYVVRNSDAQDARIKRLSLTTRGKAALAAAHLFKIKYERDLAKKIGQTHVKSLRIVLESIVAESDEENILTIRPL
jgi:DNA-binding MarR family transcriptional regulator